MPNSPIQSSTQGLTLDQFRSLATNKAEGSYKLSAQKLEVGKQKINGMTVIAGPGPGRQKALAAFKEVLRENYGTELADMTLSSMGLKKTKLGVGKVRMLDYHLGQARERLASRYLKPSEFDSSVARLESNVKLKTWVNELKAIKDPVRQKQLINQGITDVYNHYESKLGNKGALADRDTVLQNSRWQEFSQFVAKNFNMPVVRPNSTVEENSVQVVEASLMQVQFTQLKDVLDSGAKDWVNNGRTGSVQLLMASAMLDTMNGMWLEHKSEGNADWLVSSGPEKKSQWKTESNTHKDTLSQNSSKVEVASNRTVTLDTDEMKGHVKPVVKAEVQGKGNVEINGNKFEMGGSATATVKAGVEAKREGVIKPGLTYEASHEHGVIAEGTVSAKLGVSLFTSGASASTTLQSPDDFSFDFGKSSAKAPSGSLEVKAEGKVGVYGKQAGSIEYRNLAKGEVSVEEFAGAKFEAKGALSASLHGSDGTPAGLKAEAKFDVFAGAEIKGKLMGSFFKTEFLEHALKTHVEANARAGVGATGSAKAEFTAENLQLSASASGTVGIGGGAGFGVAINPLAMMACGNEALSTALGRFDHELGNKFDQRAIKDQNKILLREVQNKMNGYLASYKGEVDAAFDADIRMRDELRSVTVDIGLDHLGGLDQSELQSKLLAGAETEADKLKSDKAHNPKTDSRKHVQDSVTEDLIRNMSKPSTIKV